MNGAVNKRKLTALTAIVIFIALSVHSTSWEKLLDPEHAFWMARLEHSEAVWAEAQGSTVEDIRRVQTSKCEERQRRERSEQWSKRTQEIVTINEIPQLPCSGSVYIPPQDDLRSYTMGLVNAAGTVLLPLAAELALAIALALVLIFAVPSASAWFSRWIHT